MNDETRPAARHQVLFCPFCRDAFEGTPRCPDHDLELVVWHMLPREVKPLSADARLSPYSIEAGRGWVFLGAILTLIAFLLPVLTLNGETELQANMFRFASLRAGKLWMVPLAAIAQLMILFRRRTPRGMRAVRVAVFAVALMPSVALGLTLRGVENAALAVAQRTGTSTHMTIEWGSYVVFAAAALMLHGALRLGATPADTPDSRDNAGERTNA